MTFHCSSFFRISQKRKKRCRSMVLPYFFWRRRMRHGSQVISGTSGRDLSPHESGKVRLAQRLRVETTATLKWIAERLRIGTRGHLTHLLYWRGRKKPLKKPTSVKYVKTID